MYSSMFRGKFALLAITLALAVGLAACGTESDDDMDTGHMHSGDDGGHNHHMKDAGSTDTAGWTNERMAATENGTFYVHYMPTPDPIPLNELFTMQVEVYESDKMEAPVDGAEIAVDAQMPTHGHGMNTEPMVTKVEGETGKFSVDGMKFHMPGDLQNKWAMTVEVTKDQDSDTATFEIIVKQ